ncbi:hypothetical protein A2U01_0085237, partial [Trifolium medium]|nr:hypothetical protein [Trifolium medium]
MIILNIQSFDGFQHPIILSFLRYLIVAAQCSDKITMAQ